MFTLYEVTNGFTGNSYVRCYVWTDGGEVRAREVAQERFAADGKRNPLNYYTKLSVEALFCAESPEFATLPDDDGWVEHTPLPTSVELLAELEEMARPPRAQVIAAVDGSEPARFRPPAVLGCDRGGGRRMSRKPWIADG
jgi:hypothetical protein